MLFRFRKSDYESVMLRYPSIVEEACVKRVPFVYVKECVK